MSKPNPVVRDDPYRWKAAEWKKARQWKRWEHVGLAPTLDLDDLVFNWTSGKVIDLDAKGAVTGVQLERTIEGASTVTITVRDPRQRLFSEWARRMRPPIRSKKQRREPAEVDEGWEPIQSPDLLGLAMEVHLDGAIFRLVKVSYQHQTEEASLTFEDRIANPMRPKKGERHASRAKITRAQFVLSLLREIKLTKPPFVCPELTVKQPIEKAKIDRTTDKPPSSDSDHIAKPSNNDLDRIYPRHRIGAPGAARLGERQVRQVAELAGLSPTEALHAAQIAHGESDFYPGVVQDDPGDGMVGHGLWQMTPNAWGGGATFQHMQSLGGLEAMRNPMQCARQMAWMYKQAGNSWQPWYGTRYLNTSSRASGSVLQDGQAADSSSNPSSDGAAKGETSYRKAYQYSRNKDEDSWTAIKRLGDEVNWRFFVVGEAVYFMSEEQLYRRRPRYELGPEHEGLIDLAYDIDWGKPVSELTMTVALDRWGAPPGAVVMLQDFGPPDGRWLITSVRRDWFQPTAEVTLKQPGKQKMEPASERVSRSSSAEGAEASGPTDDSATGRAYAEAEKISNRNLSYIWGGGHAHCGQADSGTGTPSKDSGPPPGFDCSGYVCACLAAGGMGFQPGSPAMASGGLASWGEPGPGEKLTVWANATHTFIEFHGLGPGKWADTSREAAPPSSRGPHLRRGTRSTAGFTARHWKGT